MKTFRKSTYAHILHIYTNEYMIKGKLLCNINITIIWFNEHLLTKYTEHNTISKHYNKQVHDTCNDNLGNNGIKKKSVSHILTFYESYRSDFLRRFEKKK